MVKIYQRKWRKGFLKSFLGYLRDLLVLTLPIKRLPPFLSKLLYGANLRFAFFVHPRNYQDIFISAPFFKPSQFLFHKETAFRFFSHFPPFVLDRVRTKEGINGIVIGQFIVPELMFTRRKQTRKCLEKMLTFATKILEPGSVIGLGGWFPMVTRSGLTLSEEAKKFGLSLTNGHCGTLASIYMTVEKIANMINIKVDNLTLAVIGVGRMGFNVVRSFNGKVGRLILIDIHEGNLRKAEDAVKSSSSKTVVSIVLLDPKNTHALRNALRESHIGICATSNLRNLLKIKDMPLGYIAIDDSRPEALPRDPKMQRIVLEGGLLKIKGATLDYNYGFGQDENVFGCLGESFLLALDRGRTLKPTLGEVDMANFHNLLRLCREKGVTEGDLKSNEVSVSSELITNAFKMRKLNQDHPMSSTI